MEIDRYIIIQAIKTDKHELIPLWDQRIVFENTEMYGNVITLIDDIYKKHFYPVECIFDLITKKLEVGIELDNYPIESNLEYKKGENILYEKSHHKLAEAIISNIVYEEYDMEITRGSELDSWYLAKFKNITIEGNSLYAIKNWKPFYVLDNGIKIKWPHQLFHKVS